MARRAARRSLAAVAVALVLVAWTGARVRASTAGVDGAERTLDTVDTVDTIDVAKNTADTASDEERCGRCHERARASWTASRHALSASNVLFATDLHKTPRAWCIGCHAPGVSSSRVLFGVVDKRHGVRCTTCHIDTAGLVLSAGPPTVAGQSAHPMRQEPALGDERACARCHEFARPGEDVLLQATVTEWRTSRAAAQGITCQQCHMKGGLHSFPGAHDTRLLTDSFVVDVSRPLPGVVRIRVRAPGVAHRAPTGDLSRALRVSLCRSSDDACASPLHTVELSRRFVVERSGVLSLVADTTVPPDGERVFDIEDQGEAHGYVVDYWHAPTLQGELADALIMRRLTSGTVPRP